MKVASWRNAGLAAGVGAVVVATTSANQAGHEVGMDTGSVNSRWEQGAGSTIAPAAIGVLPWIALTAAAATGYHMPPVSSKLGTIGRSTIALAAGAAAGALVISSIGRGIDSGVERVDNARTVGMVDTVTRSVLGTLSPGDPATKLKQPMSGAEVSASLRKHDTHHDPRVGARADDGIITEKDFASWLSEFGA